MRSLSQAETCGAAVDSALSCVPPGIETNDTGWCSAHSSLNSFAERFRGTAPGDGAKRALAELKKDAAT